MLVRHLPSNYTDPDFWRPASVVDQLNNQTNISYSGEAAVEASLQNFNGGNSVSDSRTTVDGFGRPILGQRLQGPGATNYDTAETDYNNVGRPSRSTMPFSATAGTTNSSAPGVNTTYDALGRVLTTTDADGGTVSYTYTNNDVLQKVSGTQTFQKQLEYDGLGITYNFVDSVSGHNAGHVYGITNNLNSSRSQTFTYDQLNRIYTAKTAATTGSYCWGYQYNIDVWGNLTSQSGLSGYNGCTEYTMAVTADGNNHISAMSYDASGNTLGDGSNTYA